ncbi:MAG TPA: SGNH/GDSL hydrolase family protein [Clostridia bacterium]|nr:SGNH/GDSL hydrolase family protein [Clostridia bacterium]
MSIASKLYYLDEILCELQKQWPNNRTINIVCHGHSVPSGYFATPFVDTFNSYPHLLHRTIKERFPFASLNVIVTAIGGENSLSGSKRFHTDVLCHKPDIITIDYSLNDRGIGLEASKSSWSEMIESALENNIQVILLTPSWDKSYFEQNESWRELVIHAEQIRVLAENYNIGLSDSFNAFKYYIENGGDLVDLLSHGNHPNRKGHELITRELAKWFIAK